MTGEEVDERYLELSSNEGDAYGKNVEVPGDGSCTVEVRIEPPGFVCHDDENGDRYGEVVAVTFENVDIDTGQD